MADSKYTRDEVEAILARATSRERGDMSHDELVDAAREAGIDPASVEAAAQEVREERSLVLARTRRRARRRRKFFEHLQAFVVVNSALFAIDWFTSPGIEWAMYPLIGWGIGLVLDGLTRLGPEDPEAAERKDLKELERLRRLERRRKGKRGFDLQLGPNFNVRVDLPNEEGEGVEVDAGRGRSRGTR